jgi:hypothetical protein
VRTGLPQKKQQGRKKVVSWCIPWSISPLISGLSALSTLRLRSGNSRVRASGGQNPFTQHWRVGADVGVGGDGRTDGVVDGMLLGVEEGHSDGSLLGELLGLFDGISEGMAEGVSDGMLLGMEDGDSEG